MEKENNENQSNGKAKVLSSTSNSYNNIQPRVVLQRLSKDYTFGVASGSDIQPSTSGCLSPNNKSPEVDSSVSDDTSDSIINTGDDSLVTPSTSKPTTSGTYFRQKEVIEFRVAPLKEIELSEIQLLRNRHIEDSSSDCSYHSSPKEVVVVEESKTETEGEEEVEESEEIEEGEDIEEAEDIEVGEEIEEGEEVEESEELEEGEEIEEGGGEVEEVECEECIDTDADKFDKPTSPESVGSEENCIRELGRTEAKIRKAISFLKLLIDTYGRRVESTIEIDQPAIPGPSESPVPVRRPVTRSIVIRPQRNNLKDCLVRVWLSIRGQKKKKKFHVRLSQLILLLKNKHHPLHKFRNTLNLRTLRFLSDNELRVMARVLSDFVCAKRVRF